MSQVNPLGVFVGLGGVAAVLWVVAFFKYRIREPKE